MSLLKPSGGDDARRTFAVLMGFYDAIVELFSQRPSSTVPTLKSITSPTHAEARQHVGDYAGNAGPRAMIVCGKDTPIDGYQGIFVWDATSILDDDGFNTLQPNAVGLGRPGRWRRGTW